MKRNGKGDSNHYDSEGLRSNMPQLQARHNLWRLRVQHEEKGEGEIMRKIVCDRCGTEIKEEEIWVITWADADLKPVHSVENPPIELCPKCHDDVIAFTKVKP